MTDTYAQLSDNDQQHIDSICRRHDIKWMGEKAAINHILNDCYEYSLLGSSFGVQSRNRFTNALYWRGLHVVEQGSEEQNYFVALHELGHIMLEHEPGNYEKRVAQEIEATEWAYKHAQYFPSDETVCATLDSLSTYTHLEDAIARGEVEASKHYEKTIHRNS